MTGSRAVRVGGPDGPDDPLPDAVLDLRGLKCPLPVLRTRKALRGLPPPHAVVVICTDPLAAIDIPNLVREEGARLDRVERDGDLIRFRIVPRRPPGLPEDSRLCGEPAG